MREWLGIILLRTAAYAYSSSPNQRLGIRENVKGYLPSNNLEGTYTSYTPPNAKAPGLPFLK